MRVHVMWIWPAEAEAEMARPPAPPPIEERIVERPAGPEEAMTLLRLLRELRGYL